MWSASKNPNICLKLGLHNNIGKSSVWIDSLSNEISSSEWNKHFCQYNRPIRSHFNYTNATQTVDSVLFSYVSQWMCTFWKALHVCSLQSGGKKICACVTICSCSKMGYKSIDILEICKNPIFCITIYMVIKQKKADNLHIGDAGSSRVWHLPFINDFPFQNLGSRPHGVTWYAKEII